MKRDNLCDEVGDIGSLRTLRAGLIGTRVLYYNPGVPTRGIANPARLAVRHGRPVTLKSGAASGGLMVFATRVGGMPLLHWDSGQSGVAVGGLRGRVPIVVARQSCYPDWKWAQDVAALNCNPRVPPA